MFFNDEYFKSNMIQYSMIVDKIAKQIEKKMLPIQTRIGVIIDNDIITAATIRAILLKKCVFIPIDNSVPSFKRKQLFNESKCGAYIEKGELKSTNLYHLTNDKEKLAYIIFTSGTTGRSKGVKISLKNLENYVSGFEEIFPFSQEDHVLIATSLAFDLSYTGFFMALKTGCRFTVVPKEHFHNPSILLEDIINNKISIMKITPTQLSMLFTSNKNMTIQAFKTLRLLILGGEMINPTVIEELLLHIPNMNIINHYGPCETTIGCCAKLINQYNYTEYLNSVTIGKPFANNSIVLVDDKMFEVENGKIGHLLIYGNGVGLGYLQDEIKNNGFCVWNGKPAFLTSDLGYWNSNNEIVLCGRKESIIKFKGYRLSLQEINQEIQKLKNVDKSYVTIDKQYGFEILICYYTGKINISTSVFRKQLRRYLPDYMIPSKYYKIEQFNQNPNGKVDVENVKIIYPHTKALLYEVERKIYKCWVKIGGAEDIELDDSFFEFGMDSLMMVEFSSELSLLFSNHYLSYSLISRLSNINALSNYLSDDHEVTHESVFNYNELSDHPEEYYNSFYIGKMRSFQALPTQRYYLKSGFCRDVIMHKVIALPYSINESIIHIKKWMLWDSSLRSALEDDNCIIYSADSVKSLKICTINYNPCDNNDWKNHLQKLKDHFFKSNFGFFPICISLSNEFTICVFYFRHMLCKESSVNSLLTICHDVKLPSLDLELNKLIENIGSYQTITSPDYADILHYWDYINMMIHKHFKPLNTIKCSSSFRVYHIKNIVKFVSKIDLLIAWISACVIGELLNEPIIPISIWKNRIDKSILNSSAWDLSDFEYYLVESNSTHDSLIEFMEKADKVHSLSNWWMAEMLNICPDSVSLDNIYLNIIYKSKELFNRQIKRDVELLQNELNKNKKNSIHGICIYGEINEDDNTLSICYSSNYHVVDPESFIIRFDELLNSLMEND